MFPLPSFHLITWRNRRCCDDKKPRRQDRCHVVKHHLQYFLAKSYWARFKLTTYPFSKARLIKSSTSTYFFYIILTFVIFIFTIFMLLKFSLYSLNLSYKFIYQKKKKFYLPSSRARHKSFFTERSQSQHN